MFGVTPEEAAKRWARAVSGMATEDDRKRWDYRRYRDKYIATGHEGYLALMLDNVTED